MSLVKKNCKNIEKNGQIEEKIDANLLKIRLRWVRLRVGGYEFIKYGDQLSEIELIEKNKDKKLKAGSIMSEMEVY